MTTRRFFKHLGMQQSYSEWYAGLKVLGIAKTIDEEDRTVVVLKDGRRFTHFHHDADEEGDDPPAPAAKGSHNPDVLAKALETLAAEQAAAIAELEQLRKENDDMSTTKGKADAAAFGKTVSDIWGRDQGSRRDAMRKARLENPEAYAAHQASSTPAPRQDVAKLRAAGKVATAEVEKRVNEIRAAHKCSRVEAMRRLRREAANA
jgi:hypothetical protein